MHTSHGFHNPLVWLGGCLAQLLLAALLGRPVCGARRSRGGNCCSGRGGFWGYFRTDRLLLFLNPLNLNEFICKCIRVSTERSSNNSSAGEVCFQKDSRRGLMFHPAPAKSASGKAAADTLDHAGKVRGGVRDARALPGRFAGRRQARLPQTGRAASS